MHFPVKFNGLGKVLGGKFGAKKPPAVRVVVATLHLDGVEELYDGFFIDGNHHPIVGSDGVHISFVKPGFDKRFLIDEPLSNSTMFPMGFIAGNSGISSLGVKPTSWRICKIWFS